MKIKNEFFIITQNHQRLNFVHENGICAKIELIFGAIPIARQGKKSRYFWQISPSIKELVICNLIPIIRDGGAGEPWEGGRVEGVLYPS